MAMIATNKVSVQGFRGAAKTCMGALYIHNNSVALISHPWAVFSVEFPTHLN